MTPVYKRVLLKISGQSLAGERGGDRLERSDHGAQIVRSHRLELGVVCGGGNIIRGITASAEGINRTAADYMGMLGGVINALALQDALEKCGVDTRVLSAIEIKQVAEPHIRRVMT
jgi:uridylate kinase